MITCCNTIQPRTYERVTSGIHAPFRQSLNGTRTGTRPNLHTATYVGTGPVPVLYQSGVPVPHQVLSEEAIIPRNYASLIKLVVKFFVTAFLQSLSCNELICHADNSQLSWRIEFRRTDFTLTAESTTAELACARRGVIRSQMDCVSRSSFGT